jgi:hypothetical protein
VNGGKASKPRCVQTRRWNNAPNRFAAMRSRMPPCESPARARGAMIRLRSKRAAGEKATFRRVVTTLRGPLLCAPRRSRAGGPLVGEGDREFTARRSRQTVRIARRWATIDARFSARGRIGYSGNAPTGFRGGRTATRSENRYGSCAVSARPPERSARHMGAVADAPLTR